MVLSSSDPSDHSKPCTLCHTPRDVLIRCQIDETEKWHMVCPGKCWTSVSGGAVDGDTAHPHYRYGGAWKNKVAAVSAKKPKRSKKNTVAAWDPSDKKYVTNDRVGFKGKVWVCRKSHFSREGEAPDQEIGLWKEDDSGAVFTDDEGDEAGYAS